MPIFTSQPNRPTRIEPDPQVAAFFDRRQRAAEAFALAVAALGFLYFVGHFIAFGLRRAGWL
jgi:hypothetical protein